MKHGRMVVLGLALLGVLPLVGARAGELPEAEWREARKEAKSLMKTPGYRHRKEEYIGRIARDNSRRAAELLVQWSVRSLKFQQGTLKRDLDKAQKDYDKAEAKRDRDKKSFTRCKQAFEKAHDAYEVESVVQFHLAEGLAAISDAEAVRYLVESGLPALVKQRGTESLQVSVARSALLQSGDLVRDTALALAKDATQPRLRIVGINWIGKNRAAEGLDAALDAVSRPPVAVQRAAVKALQALDDRRSVKPLIDAMQEAGGLLRAEIDHLLHRFTGKSFEGSAETWKKWWAREGTAWMEKPDPKRFTVLKEQQKGGTMVRFYGIPTPSHHVVFVVDRSKSMDEPAGEKSRQKTRPTTGGDPASGETVAGNTKMEVAKNQLGLSIDELSKDVHFAIVFYSNDVMAWQEPPELKQATPKNKEKAKEWVKAVEPFGPTLTFGALMKALEYADTFGGKKPGAGADTIFLLSDGSPTTSDSRVLEGEELEQAYRAFMAKNELHHCVVHTIGIGPGHNRSVLKRLARDTGGTYKGVGNK